MSTSTTLLEQAYAVLAEGGAHSNRASCWIARAALESVVDELLADLKCAAPAASMRSKLTVLEVACQKKPEVPALAEYAWSGLSRASHHHAFELTPATVEVGHLMELVRRLADHAHDGGLHDH